MNQLVHTKHRHLIILLTFAAALLGWSNVALGQHRYSAYTGQTSGEYQLDSDITLDHTIYVSGTLIIHAGNAAHKITMKVGSGYVLFFTNGGTLKILGESNKKITLDGGAVFSTPFDARTTPTTWSHGNTIIQCNSNMTLEHVILQNSTGGRAIEFPGSGTCNISNSLIRGFRRVSNEDNQPGGQGGAAIYCAAGDTHTVTMTNVEVTTCFSTDYGNITSDGGASTKLYLDGCTIHKNKSSHGGGIFWSAGGGSITLRNNTKIQNNVATGQGGGIFNESDMTITSAIISGNSAVLGGGLFFQGYDGGSSFSGKAFNISVASGVEVYSNTATGAGGGAYLNFRPTRKVGFNASGTPINTEYKFELNGGKIHNNTAPYGGGVYIEDHCPAYNQTTGGTHSGTISKTINIKSGSIYGNKATNGNGGAIYLYRFYDGGLFSYSSAGTVNISISGGSVYQNSATSNGGAFCFVDDYADQYNSACNVSVSGTPDIFGNSCDDSGAGFYLSKATFTMTGGNIGKDGTTDSKTNHNVASKMGGGIYIANTKGTCYLSGGSVNYNEATNGGGGVYIPSSSSLTFKNGITITGNKTSSVDGGGVYQGGTMTIDGTSVNITGNKKNSSDNNVYLPSGKTIAVGTGISYNSVQLGIYTQNDATVGSPIKVLSGNDTQLSGINTSMHGGISKIKDDKKKHLPYYPSSPGNLLYFALAEFDYGPFSAAPTNPITTAQQLYQFMCYVNGVNGYSTATPNATGTLGADINMSGITKLWIPIGGANLLAETTPYTGTFEGKGYVVSGLKMTKDTYYYANYGLFGTTQGATIKDLFVTGCNYSKDGEGAMGCIVGDMKSGTLQNSEGAGQLTATNSGCIVGGLVGKKEAGNIYSSSAMADMTGYQMGGIAGSNAGNVWNSFANPKFTHSGSGTEYVGGLVAVNTGNLQNCYVRLERAQSLGSAHFGMLAGSNTGSNTIVKCYAPDKSSSQFNLPSSYYYLYNNASTGLSNCNTYSKAIAPYLYNTSGDNVVTGTTTKLVNMLNTWVNSNSGYAPWRRTMAGGYRSGAGNINSDYPVHQYSGTKCVASTDGIVLDYTTSLDAMLTRHTSNATVNLYANDNTSKGTGTNVMVYIDENISLLQSTNNAITAYTCQILPGNTRSWHFVSSSLSNSGIGFTYGQNALFNWDPNPCHVTISTNDDASLFPSDLPKVGGYSDVSRIDLYCFYEPEYHWINLKRNSDSHWHMNATTTPINYTNETTLTPGKGYLVSADKDLLLQNKGTLNNGDVSVNLGYSPHQEWAGLVGYNLIGNPYQSYLSFTAFANESGNAGLWYDYSKGRAMEPTYAVYDEAMGGYIQYKEGASRGSKSAPDKLNMHQGFMVRSSGATRAKFTNAMRTNDGTSTGIREEQPAFPLINFTVTDIEGVNDFAVLELGRDADAGAEKLRANDCKGWLYLHHNGEDYGILFRTEVDDYQPLWFEAEEEGIYTLSWETANAEFESLTLIDNITGVTTDMLTNDSYTFEANPDQYTSRFKIVIGDYKDIEENEGGASTGSVAATFAYYANGEIHLVETCQGASLQIIDMTGRVILGRDAAHASAISTTGMAPGVYLLRLTTNKGTKIQKMVIE